MRTQPIPSYLETLPFDLIIIGAGVNGAGIARDAAMRGLKVLLLEKDDICSGTSAWSTRLMHGGLRYLEYAEIDLVRESLRERERLFWTAPHLVKPLRFLLPIYNYSQRPPWMIQIGMLGYDMLSFDKSVGTHRMLSKSKALERIPGLNPDGLRGGALYYDGQVELAERICVENAMSAHDHGAVILTYAKVTRFILENNTVKGVEFTDSLDGGTHRAYAPVTLNVAGPWVDEVLQGLGRPVKPLMGGTKGTHLVVDPFPGAPGEAIYFEAKTDYRPMFIIPWEGKYLIGTTDLRYTGRLDEVKADQQEIDYLLSEANRIVPTANLTRDSVLYTYCGVRPLPYQEKGKTGSITRRHIIHDHAPEVNGLVSIIGGKLTTFRALSEQAVDKVFKKLGKKSPRCATWDVPLPGAATTDLAAFSRWFIQTSGLPEVTAQRLLHVYGTRSVEILTLLAQNQALKEVFSPESGAIAAEIVLAFEQEMAQTLADVLLRRAMVAFNSRTGLDAVDNATKICQKYLGWDAQRAANEVAAYCQYIERFWPRELVQRKDEG